MPLKLFIFTPSIALAMVLLAAMPAEGSLGVNRKNAPASHQSESSLKILNDYQAFHRWVIARTTFSCRQNPVIERTMRAEIPKTLFFGLRAIGRVNEQVLANRLSSSAGKRLMISCVPNDKGRSWSGAFFNKRNLAFREGKMVYANPYGNLILIPMNMVPTNPIEGTRSEVNPLEESQFIVHDLGTRQLNQHNTVLHEYLHFLGFDNAHVADHTAVVHVNAKVRMDDDVVFACAELAYPYWSLQRELNPSFSLSKACHLCTMATVSQSRVSIDPRRHDWADRKCADFRNYENRLQDQIPDTTEHGPTINEADFSIDDKIQSVFLEEHLR